MKRVKRSDKHGKSVVMTKPGAAEKPPPAALGLVIMAVGSLPILAALGVIRVQNSTHTPTFVMGAVGVAFFLSGLLIVTQALGLPPRSIISRILGAILIGSFLTPFVWLALGANLPLFGRLAFGAPVVIFILLFLLQYAPGVRRIGPGSDGNSSV